ncbi:MAG: carboxylating nicotinate-nucleotide diphosphorylase [Chlamydiae bacterium]|nr:carboxylating nicotinate-nucleotide diphosphorylase [Chlamydiota bacterium]
MKTSELPWHEIDPIIAHALEEDVRAGDLTTDYFIPKDAVLEAEWVAKMPCTVAGLPIVDRVLKRMDASIRSFWMVQDGEKIESGKFGLVQGSARSILKAERTAVNFLQRLCGIATLTTAFVQKAQKYNVKIYDTRKTTPSLRVIEKYAVRMGGGHNHRLSLNEMILVKENHQYVMEDAGFTDWKSVVQKIRKDYPKIQIGFEVLHVKEVQRVVQAGADFVLLDNMDPSQVHLAVKEWKGKILLEASGGIRLDNVEAYAQTGVDRISVGALTHSVRAVDISLEVLGVR